MLKTIIIYICYLFRNAVMLPSWIVHSID